MEIAVILGKRRFSKALTFDPCITNHFYSDPFFTILQIPWKQLTRPWSNGGFASKTFSKKGQI